MNCRLHTTIRIAKISKSRPLFTFYNWFILFHAVNAPVFYAPASYAVTVANGIITHDIHLYKNRSNFKLLTTIQLIKSNSTPVCGGFS